jgi:hypothetical protein
MQSFFPGRWRKMEKVKVPATFSSENDPVLKPEIDLSAFGNAVAVSNHFDYETKRILMY